MPVVPPATIFDGWDCYGTVAVDSVPLLTKAWALQPDSVKSLWTLGDVRGDDVNIPGYPGSFANPRRATATVVTLNMVFLGCRDYAGDGYSNSSVGLEANVTYFYNQVVAQPANTRTVVLTMPSGATRTAQAHLFNLTAGAEVGGLTRYSLTMSVPAGVIA